jgi:hypothetical protein
MKKLAIALALLSAAGIAAAEEAATAPAAAPQIVCAAPAVGRSVQYFLAHPKEIDATLKECRRRAGVIDCREADEAADARKYAQMRQDRLDAFVRSVEAHKRLTAVPQR